MTHFERVYKAVSQIPQGAVASYGDVAKAIGQRRGARLVGWALGALKEANHIPWQRVINKQRKLSIVNPRISPMYQKELLEKEGRVLEQRSDGWYVTGDDWFLFDALSEEKNLL
jgi:methylated-DNA-protein-cysteine methyltransferase-like protein